MFNSFLKIKNTAQNQIVIERSKFICYLKSVEDENDAKEFINEIKKKNSLATHNCYAYICDEKGQNFKFSDDGEPQGTAGLPILEVLKNNMLYKTVAVVTRYFGGIKLGTGGLARAYSSAVKECFDVAEKELMVYSSVSKLECDYDFYNRIIKDLSSVAVITDSDFSNGVKIDFYVKKEDFSFIYNKVVELSSGKVAVKLIEEKFCPFKVAL